MEFLAAFIWIGSIIGCFFLAKEKNRSVLGWTGLALLFGVIPLIILAFLSSLPKTLEV
jgi:hypothetical protein